MIDKDFEALRGDPLFQRLWPISQAVLNGCADAETRQAWDGLREVVLARIEASHACGGQAAVDATTPSLRAMIQAYVDLHWPTKVLH